MSLLLDALKKAEEAKRKRLEAERNGQGGEAGEQPAAAPEAAAVPASAAPVEFPSLSFDEEQAAAPAVPAEAEPVSTLSLAPVESAPTEPTPEAVVLSEPPIEQAASAEQVPKSDTEGEPPILTLDQAADLPAADAQVAAVEPTVASTEPPALSLDVPAPGISNSVAAARLSGRSGKGGAYVEPTLSAEPVASADAKPAAVAPEAPARMVAAAPERKVEARPEAPIKLSPEATRQLFDSKTKQREPMSRQQRIVVLAGTVLVVFAACAGWLWWKAGGGRGLLMASQSGITPAVQPVAGLPPPPAAPSGVTAPAPTATPVPTPEVKPAAPDAGDKPASSTQVANKEGDGSPSMESRLPVRPRRGDRARVLEVPANLAANGVRFVRSETAPTVPSDVEQGYGAYQRGDMQAAARAYQHELGSDPNNHDALLGLAAVALREHHENEARAYYQRLLSIEPHDPTALAAMATLTGNGRDGMSEAQLRHAFDAQPTPEAATSLGTMLAKQQRWREAQDYYFKAYNAVSDEPDYAFNLAVSLDALGQRALAAQYYERALTLGATRAASFDRNAAHRRLAELKAS